MAIAQKLFFGTPVRDVIAQVYTPIKAKTETRSWFSIWPKELQEAAKNVQILLEALSGASEDDAREIIAALEFAHRLHPLLAPMQLILDLKLKFPHYAQGFYVVRCADQNKICGYGDYPPWAKLQALLRNPDVVELEVTRLEKQSDIMGVLLHHPTPISKISCVNELRAIYARILEERAQVLATRRAEELSRELNNARPNLALEVVSLFIVLIVFLVLVTYGQ